MSTPTLDLGDDLHPPAGLLLERGFVAGAPKTGKTSTCVVLVEEADRLGIPSVVVTPNDVWHGLRSSADGESPGLEHVIFGGSFGDRPLQVGMGRGLARAAADGLRMVLTTARMSLDDRATLVADFLEELLDVNRTPLLVVIDECHRFAPQGAGGSSERRRCREAVIAAIATGRMPAYLGVWIVTQRLAMLATDARELCNASIVHKLRGSNDIRFVRPWLEDFLDDPAVLDRLTKLQRGEAIVVAPDEGDIAGVYQIRAKRTFDTSNSDDALAGAQRQPKGRSTVDLAALDTTLGDALREAEEHDPETLRRRVAALQHEVQQLRARPAAAAAPAPAPRTIEVEVERLVTPYTPAEHHRVYHQVQDAMRDLRARRTELAECADRIDGVEGVLRTAVDAIGTWQPPADARASSAPGPPLSSSPRPLSPRPIPPAAATSNGNPQSLRAGAVRMLAELAGMHPMRLTRSQLGKLAKVKHSGGTFGTYYGELKRGDLIDEDAAKTIGITPAGFEYLGQAPADPKTPDEIVTMWRGRLRKGAVAMLDALDASRGTWRRRSDLADAADLEVTGGTFGTYLGDLRRAGILDEDGQLVRLGGILHDAEKLVEST